MSTDKKIFSLLLKEFPEELISWRVGATTKDKKKGIALAYIDARDVMRRLDEVLGPDNWMDTYIESPKGRVFCTLSLRIDGEWISKTDGAGDSDVEAEKGAISDAFKRAAVKWGIGRYLYDMPAVWMPINEYKELVGNPWDYMRKPANKPSSEGQKPPAAPKELNKAQNTAPKSALLPDDIEAEVVKMEAQFGETTTAEMVEVVASAWRDWALENATAHPSVMTRAGAAKRAALKRINPGA